MRKSTPPGFSGANSSSAGVSLSNNKHGATRVHHLARGGALFMPTGRGAAGRAMTHQRESVDKWQPDPNAAVRAALDRGLNLERIAQQLQRKS